MTIVLLVVVLVIVVLFAWLGLVQPWMHCWGATDGELVRTWAGDDVVREPNYFATLAITIDASPAEIWPWLRQLGNGRGGLYSYDGLDRLFGVLDADSANEILPGIPEPKPGDVIPIGHAPAAGFPVVAVERMRHLVLGSTSAPGGVQWSWTFALVPVSPGRTRLISRNRGMVPAGIRGTITRCILDPTAFLMTRRMLLGLKRRAERLHRLGPAGSSTQTSER